MHAPQNLHRSESGRPSGSVRRDGVELWKVDLDRADFAEAAACSVLSAEERRRAERGAPAVRRRRLLSRAWLRTVLASYTGVPPEALEFQRGAFGKPTLVNSPAPEVHFNLTSSGDCCLIAVTRIGPVGVDVERVCALPDVDAIARRFFSPCEAAALDRLHGDAKLAHFYDCWTRNEAYVKARGYGLSRRFGDCDRRGWTFLSLRPGPGLVGALALPQAPAEVC